MLKTHKISRIYRVSECDLEHIKDIVVQVEHIPQPIRNTYNCLVEVVSHEDYNTEMKHDITLKELNTLKKTHEQLCRYIIEAFDNRLPEADKIIDHEKIVLAFKLAKERLC